MYPEYKELSKFNNERSNNPFLKECAKDLNRHITKKIYTGQISTWKDAQHHWELGKYKSKPTMTYHFIPIRMINTHTYTFTCLLIYSKFSNNKCWWRCGEIGILIHSYWECKMVRSLKKNALAGPQNVKSRVIIYPSNSIFLYILKRIEKIYSHKTCTYLFIAIHHS